MLQAPEAAGELAYFSDDCKLRLYSTTQRNLNGNFIIKEKDQQQKKPRTALFFRFDYSFVLLESFQSRCQMRRGTNKRPISLYKRFSILALKLQRDYENKKETWSLIEAKDWWISLVFTKRGLTGILLANKYKNQQLMLRGKKPDWQRSVLLV